MIICFLLCLSNSTSIYAVEEPTWTLTGRRQSQTTIFTVAAEGLPQDTSCFELSFLFPAGKKVTNIKPLFQNEDGSSPDCHVTQQEENGKLRTTIYFVNKIGNPYPKKALLQFELSGDLTKSEVSLESYMVLNQQLKVSVQKSGTLDFKLEYQSSGSSSGSSGSWGGSGSSGSFGDTTKITEQDPIEVKEETKDGIVTQTITYTDSANKTVLEVVLKKTEEAKEKEVTARYYLTKGEVKRLPETDIVSMKLELSEPKLPKEVKELLDKEEVKKTIPLEFILPKEALAEQLNQKNVKEVVVNVSVGETKKQSDWKSVDIILAADTLAVAKKEKKAITVTIENKDGFYSWEFTKAALSNADPIKQDASLFLEVVPVSETEEVSEVLKKDKKYAGGGITAVSRKQNMLPVQAELTLSLPKNSGFSTGKRVYLYQFNPTTKKLETLVRSFNYFVGKDNCVTLHVISTTTYVLLPKAAANGSITALISQISVPKSLTLTLKEDESLVRETLEVGLPPHLEKVTTFDQKLKGSAYGGVKVQFKSSNKKVVLVGRGGLVTAVGEGTAKITTTVTLFSGKTKTFTTVVTVSF